MFSSPEDFERILSGPEEPWTDHDFPPDRSCFTRDQGMVDLFPQELQMLSSLDLARTSDFNNSRGLRLFDRVEMNDVA